MTKPSDDIIPGLKPIYITGQFGSPNDDDPSLPFKIEINYSPPEFMQVTFVMMHGGSERAIIRSKTREAIDTFIARNNVTTHPRFRHYEITGPGSLVERVERAR
jgi:hypothetical protein